jgi:hypothetical protein
MMSSLAPKEEIPKRYRSESFSAEFKTKLNVKQSNAQEKVINEKPEAKVGNPTAPIDPKNVDDVYDWRILTNQDHTLTSLKTCHINDLKLTAMLEI